MGWLDSPTPERAMELVEDDVSFLLVLPNGPVSGSTREELWDYVARRPAVVRVHHVMRETTADDLEVVYGYVTDDDVETGAFLASVHLSPAGKMQRYLVYFDLSYRLFDTP